MMLAMTAQPSPHDPPTASSTPTIVARAAQGDEEAWNALAALYGKRLYAMARSRLGDDQLAEDVAQSVFVTLAQKLKAGAKDAYQEQGRFESWLFRIAMNRVRDIARKQIRRGEVVADLSDSSVRSEEPGVSERSNAGEELDALRRAMRELPEQDREVVELRHHAGLSFKQIASSLDLPMGTVLARHHRALRKLRTMIESQATPEGEPARDEVTP